MRTAKFDCIKRDGKLQLIESKFFSQLLKLIDTPKKQNRASKSMHKPETVTKILIDCLLVKVLLTVEMVNLLDYTVINIEIVTFSLNS